MELDQDLNRIGIDQVILDQGPLVPSPNYVHVRNGNIVVSSSWSVIFSDMNGVVEWVAGSGALGSGHGEFHVADGVQIDIRQLGQNLSRRPMELPHPFTGP